MPVRDKGDMDQFLISEPDDTEAHDVAPDPDQFLISEPDDTEAHDAAPDSDQFSGSELDDTEEQDVAPDPEVEEIARAAAALTPCFAARQGHRLDLIGDSGL